jgi:hypothetical protein
MITQILGVALISLLTITPTIQQNIPNIEIQTQNNTIPTNLTNKIVNNVSWSAYYVNNSWPVELFSFEQITTNGYNYQPNSATGTNVNAFSFFINDNFYFNTINTNLTSAKIREAVYLYYFNQRGGNPTSESFSFVINQNTLGASSTFYTYTVNGSQGSMSGRIFIKNSSDIDSNTAALTNNNISLNIGSNMNNLIQQLQPVSFLENFSVDTGNNTILYYYLNQAIDFTQPGNFTRNLYGMTNYGYTVLFGQFNVNLIADTTPPTITGPTTINRQVGNITTTGLIQEFTVSDTGGIDNLDIRDLNNNVITSWTPYNQTGSYNLVVRARDNSNNVTVFPFTLVLTTPPPPDTTPPTIVGPGVYWFNLGSITTNTQLLATDKWTVSDNVAILQVIILGDIDYEIAGTYSITIQATDTANNSTQKIVSINILDNSIPDGYNPLTDLLSGIFGGALSMIFTIGTINILGLRLLDAMGVIILGTVLLFVYKAIKGGS